MIIFTKGKTGAKAAKDLMDLKIKEEDILIFFLLNPPPLAAVYWQPKKANNLL
jgi:hypothetical protein